MDRRLNTFVLLFLAAMLVVHGYLLWSMRGKILEGYPDFTSFYGAGKMVLQGQGRALYDAQAQWNVQQQFASRVRIRKGPLPYLRPPFEALLFVPFALLSYPAAYVVWAVMNVAAAMAAVLMVRNQMALLSQYPAWLAALLPLSFTPVFLAVLQGQDSIFLLLFYALAYVALLEGAEFRAGCLLGLGLFKPHLVVPFALMALLRRKKKIALGLFCVAAALVLISASVVSWDGLLRYPRYVWFLEQHSGRGLVLPRDTPSLRGLVEGSLSGWLPGWAVLSLIGVSSVAVLLWATSVADSPPSAKLAFCQVMIATFLVSYHAFAYDLSMFLLPVLLVFAHVSESDQTRTGLTRLALLAPAALLFFGLIYPWLWLRYHVMNMLAIVLLFWMWGIAREMAELPKRNSFRTVQT